LKKVDYKKEGFDVRKVKDKIYVLKGHNKYEILDEATYDAIVEGKIKF